MPWGVGTLIQSCKLYTVLSDATGPAREVGAILDLKFMWCHSFWYHSGFILVHEMLKIIDSGTLWHCVSGRVAGGAILPPNVVETAAVGPGIRNYRVDFIFSD